MWAHVQILPFETQLCDHAFKNVSLVVFLKPYTVILKITANMPPKKAPGISFGTTKGVSAIIASYIFKPLQA
jgi:hypothetical protein